MNGEAPLNTLARDFADRIEALREEAEESGHGDIDYLLGMAADIASRRIDRSVRQPPPNRSREHT